MVLILLSNPLLTRQGICASNILRLNTAKGDSKMSVHALKARLAALKAGPSWQGETWRKRRKYQLRHPRIVYNPSFSRGSDEHCRWVEDTDRSGLRFVGYVTEYRDSERFRSKPSLGWYGDNFQDSTYYPVVFQLPSRNKVERYAYGYTDPYNKGAAMLCFDYCDNKDDAQRWACALAKHAAEESREEDAKFQAEQQIEDCLEDISNIRRDILALCREMKTICSKVSGVDTMRKLLKQKLEDMLEERSKKYSRIETLRDNYWAAVERY